MSDTRGDRAAAQARRAGGHRRAALLEQPQLLVLGTARRLRRGGRHRRHASHAAHELALLPAARTGRPRATGCSTSRYDPTRTTLRGYGFYGRLAKESGDWLWETAQNWRSPGFEVNDIASLGRTDYKWMQASVAPAVDDARLLVPQRQRRSSAGSSSSTTMATAPICRARSGGASRLHELHAGERVRHQPPAHHRQHSHARRRAS